MINWTMLRLCVSCLKYVKFLSRLDKQVKTSQFDAKINPGDLLASLERAGGNAPSNCLYYYVDVYDNCRDLGDFGRGNTGEPE